ncbi:LamB/YcsF family protein [Lutispora saccharofermentans]|uniref:5-oxoprolinase subunit A n=1 Tax=Lutispora saccharofermentans TaxID=3024236 RepID=A0ABT1NHA5_9FIRM|nr:5-oxoprolinase subunit PxpA [Lutispora saccharofermentans]MCQ1530624.1 LamB/YcsF family protein [Lutispora saccharofermentans]
MSKFVDLNSDVGESFGSYKLGLDQEVLKHVSSVNIACGWHAGDPLIMDDTVRMAAANGLGIGAHPGYPDLMGFGRRNMDITPKEARVYMLYQLGALHAFVQASGAKLQHVKLHGAFYNTTSVKPDLAEEVINGILEFDKNVILLALSGSYIAKRALEKGLRVAQEVFADRAYNSDGTLVSRKLPGSVIHDKNEAIERVKKMVLAGKVTAIDGKEISIAADSICVHGDNPEAVNFVNTIRKSLEAEGVELKPLNQFIR